MPVYKVNVKIFLDKYRKGGFLIVLNYNNMW